MPLRPVLSIVICAVLLTTVFSSTGSAQWRGNRQPGQLVFRWLGQGYGPGYHWQNPGPNSNYYNPYSDHNSRLISRPDLYPQQDMAPVTSDNKSVPYSVYSSPDGEAIPTPDSGQTIENQNQDDPPTGSEDNDSASPSEESGSSNGDSNSSAFQFNGFSKPWKSSSTQRSSKDFSPAGYSK